MKAAEYLTARGWVPETVLGETEDPGWIDPAPGAVEACSDDVALAIQRARDAAEERAAWVKFAAARLAWGIAGSEQGPERWDSIGEAASEADKMLALYRARFAVEVES